MLVADAWAISGDLLRADRTLDEVLSLAEETGEAWLTPELFRRKAWYALRQGFPDRAEGWFDASLRVAREQHARLFELCAARDFARFWAARDERQTASDLLAPVYGWFTEGFGTPDLQEAKTLLDELRE
jgi:predicted ATPase